VSVLGKRYLSQITALDAELKPSGEALLFDNEKIIFEALEIDFDFDAVLLSEGSDILTESEKKPDVVVDIDVSHFELAELSENVNFTRAETLKKVEIDTSHLSLE